jgi:hypothetical protein
MNIINTIKKRSKECIHSVWKMSERIEFIQYNHERMNELLNIVKLTILQKESKRINNDKT